MFASNEMLNMDITISRYEKEESEKKERETHAIFYLYGGTNVATVCNAIYARVCKHTKSV